MSTPGVILIGGPPGAGKSTLASAVAKALDIRWISCDDLVQAAKGVTTPASHPMLHVVTPGDHVGYFTETSSDRLIADAAAQHEATWPAVERVIRKHARNRASIVIEGWALRPDHVAELAREFPSITSFWLHIDEAALEARERAIVEWRAASPDPERMLANFMARSYWYNSLIKQEADANGLVSIHQPGDRTVEDLRDALLAAIG